MVSDSWRQLWLLHRRSAVNSENLHINTFGDTSYRKQKCNVIKLRLQTRNHEEVELYAVNFPVICSPLPSRVNIADYVHLDGLELADNFDNTESSDVLIGSDYYWDFVSGDSIKGDQGSDCSLQQIWMVVLRTNTQSIIQQCCVLQLDYFRWMQFDVWGARWRISGELEEILGVGECWNNCTRSITTCR